MIQLQCNLMRKTQAVWAFFILPAINITALFLADPIHENITHIAYAKHHFGFVFLWACTCSYYLWCNGTMLIHKLMHHKKSCRVLLVISCMLMIISIMIPYQNEPSLSAKLHVQIAMIATVTYIILFFYILWQLFLFHPQLKTLLQTYISFIGFLCLLFLLTGCISTMIEIAFVLFMGIFHYFIQQENL